MESVAEFIEAYCIMKNQPNERVVLHSLHWLTALKRQIELPIVCIDGYMLTGCILYTKIATDVVWHVIAFMCTSFPSMVFSVCCYSFDPSVCHVSGFRVHFKDDEHVLPFSILLSPERETPFYDCTMFSYKTQLFMSESIFHRLRSWAFPGVLHVYSPKYITELVPKDQKVLVQLRWKHHLVWLLLWIYKHHPRHSFFHTLEFRIHMASFL